MKNKKALIIAILILCFVVSFFYANQIFLNSRVYKKTIESLDGTSKTMVKLSASTLTLSTVVSAIPDDTATPVANKLADFSGWFFVIMIVIYIEKYALAILSLIAFKILVPLAIILYAIYTLKENKKVLNYVLNIILITIFLCSIIPFGVLCSNQLNTTYQDTVTREIQEIDNLCNEQADTKEGKGLLNAIASKVKTLLDRITIKTNVFLQMICVMFVINCVIPILMFLSYFFFFKWLLSKINLLKLNKIDYDHISERKKEEKNSTKC